jgi:mannose-1-phosphate guanylyltransferase
MKAMILAAGLGTRLRPLTNDRPKALVEINGRTLLEITIGRLATFGFRELIVNAHHFADMMADYLKSKNNFGLRIEISREDDLLLDTGGGLKKAAWFFLEDSNRLDAPLLLHNVDVLSNIDLHAMIGFHTENNALATLAVQSRPSSRQLLFNSQLQLAGRRIRENEETVIPRSQTPIIPNPGMISTQGTTDETTKTSSHSPLTTRHSPPLQPLAFSGIHILSPRLLPLLTESTPVFSIIDSYLRLASQGHKILAFRGDQYYWRDLGRPDDLAQASLDLWQKSLK